MLIVIELFSPLANIAAFLRKNLNERAVRLGLHT